MISRCEVTEAVVSDGSLVITFRRECKLTPEQVEGFRCQGIIYGLCSETIAEHLQDVAREQGAEGDIVDYALLGWDSPAGRAVHVLDFALSAEFSSGFDGYTNKGLEEAIETWLANGPDGDGSRAFADEAEQLLRDAAKLALAGEYEQAFRKANDHRRYLADHHYAYVWVTANLDASEVVT